VLKIRGGLSSQPGLHIALPNAYFDSLGIAYPAIRQMRTGRAGGWKVWLQPLIRSDGHVEVLSEWLHINPDSSGWFGPRFRTK